MRKLGSLFVALIIDRAIIFEYLLVSIFPDVNLTAALYDKVLAPKSVLFPI